MTILRALLLQTLASLLFLAVGLLLLREGKPLGAGILWGMGGGTVTAFSAIGGAWWAESRGMNPKQALAVIVLGMLGRLVFLGAYAVVALLVGNANGLGFFLGFGGVFLVGQVLEVALLARLGNAPSAGAGDVG